MNTKYFVCVSGSSACERWYVENIEDIIWAINKFQEFSRYKKLVVRKYEDIKKYEEVLVIEK